MINWILKLVNQKECLSAHGIDPATITTFAVRHGNAVSNSTVINTVAKYYDMAINGFSNLMRLNCTGYEDQTNPQRVGSGELAALVTSPRHQTDCRTFLMMVALLTQIDIPLENGIIMPRIENLIIIVLLYSITLYKS